MPKSISHTQSLSQHAKRSTSASGPRYQLLIQIHFGGRCQSLWLPWLVPLYGPLLLLFIQTLIFTKYCNTLDGWTNGYLKTTKLESEDYVEVYDAILAALEEVEAHQIDGPLLKQRLASWARFGEWVFAWYFAHLSLTCLPDPWIPFRHQRTSPQQSASNSLQPNPPNPPMSAAVLCSLDTSLHLYIFLVVTL